METKTARIRGLELLFNLIKTQLQSKFDCAVAAVHCLLTNEGLECLGVGDNPSGDDKPSEVLPPGWNSNQDIYTLRYRGKRPKGEFLLKAVRTGDHILHANVLFERDTSTTMTINVDKMISDDYQEYDTAYLDLPALIKNFQNEILVKLFIGTVKPSSSKEKTEEKPARPKIPPALGQGSNPRAQPDPLRVDPPSFPQVGGRDLDPLGRAGGGMLYDPFAGSRPHWGVPDPSGFGVPFGGIGALPRGAVPPGARFDPFGPPVRGPNRPGPSPDHFRPPDFDDFL